jgi:hypothetical protein
MPWPFSLRVPKSDQGSSFPSAIKVKWRYALCVNSHRPARGPSFVLASVKAMSWRYASTMVKAHKGDEFSDAVHPRIGFDTCMPACARVQFRPSGGCPSPSLLCHFPPQQRVTFSIRHAGAFPAVRSARRPLESESTDGSYGIINAVARYLIRPTWGRVFPLVSGSHIGPPPPRRPWR